jgi:hypothetical protein
MHVLLRLAFLLGVLMGNSFAEQLAYKMPLLLLLRHPFYADYYRNARKAFRDARGHPRGR